MARIERFEDLDIWKEAVAIGVDIYSITSRGKLEKDYSTKDRLRRAAISVSNNIAEVFEAGMVPQDDYERLHNKLITASKNIKGFINYLDDYESKKKNSQQE